MRFELILQDKKIILSKEEADIVTKGLIDKQDVFKIGLNVFKRSAIKGIFPLAEEVEDNKERWMAENREWDEICESMSNKSVEEKTITEMTNRIFPALEIGHIKLDDDVIATIESNVRYFFEQFPRYPRCPSRIWWPIIADIVAPKSKKTGKRAGELNGWAAKWMEIVSRNDGAIQEWLKYHG